MTDLTPDRLARLRALATEATPGPWGWRGTDDGLVELRGPGHFGPFDARLISAARAEPCIAEIIDGEDLDAVVPWITGAPTPYICDACKEAWRAYQGGDGDAFDGYRCPKEENTPTVWVNEPGHGHIVPINRFVHRQREHRSDIDPDRIGHPNAAYVAAVSPDVVLGLLDEIERLRADLAALVEVAAGAVSDATAGDPGVMALMRFLVANHPTEPSTTVTSGSIDLMAAVDSVAAGAEAARQRNRHNQVQIVAGEGATRATIGRKGVITEDGDILHVLVDGYTVPFLYQRHEVRRIGDVTEVTS